MPGYEILSELGRGGMGVVYKARQVQLNRVVALKMILSGGHASPTDLARFRGEAEAIAQVRHPNIVQVYEVGDHDGLPFFSLEYCSAGGLDGQLLNPLPPRQAAELVQTLARAVHAAHQAGIIHRDLKPANVLLAADGTPKITDFGLAKKLTGGSGLTQSGAVMGTPSYMAPEQAGGQSSRVTTLADVYALGALLYECLTGRPPFRGATAVDTVLQVLKLQPEPPSALRAGVDQDLELICLKCLAKEPAHRYASADALAADLHNWLTGNPVSVRPPTLATVLRSWLRQSFGAAGWTVPVGLASGLAMSAAVWLLMINPRLSRLGPSYRTLTGTDPPWLAPAWRVPDWLGSGLGLLALLTLGAMGLLVARFVRPLDRHADLAAGTVAGLMAAVTFFTLGFGWWAVLAGTLGDQDVQSDLWWLSQSAWDEGTPPAEARPGTRPAARPPRRRLLEKYPQLQTMPPEKRGRIVFDKIAYDVATGIPRGIWFGMVVSAGLCVAVGVAGTVTAGTLLRRDGRVRKALPAYSELIIPLTVLCSQVFLLLLAPMLKVRLNLPVWYFVLSIGLTGFAVAGVRHHWPWLVRLLIHAAWIALILSSGLLELNRPVGST